MKKCIFSFFAGVLFCLGCLAGYDAIQKTIQKPYLTVIGGVNMADGLGRQSVELIDTMMKEVKVGFIPTEIVDWSDVPKSIQALGKKKNMGLGTVIVCQEPLMKTHKKLESGVNTKQIRIAYSMFESTQIPSGWVEMLNAYFDAVAVPDRFLIEIYQNSGVRIPVFELPLGRDLGVFLETPLKSQRNSPFVFGNFGIGTDRKNHAMLIRSFHKAFGNRSDVRLVMNSRFCSSKIRKQINEEIQKLEAKNIEFTENSLDNGSYLDLMQSIDCYVTLSKGEGFSIQPREAMAMGIPSIVTNNTAQQTICETGLVRSVPSVQKEPAFYEWSKNSLGYFFPCQEADAVEALLDMERNYDAYLEKGALAREWAAQYHFEKLKPLYLTLIKPKVVILGDENKITSEYLMTSSVSLYKKYQKLAQADGKKI